MIVNMKKIFGIYLTIPAIFRNRYWYYTFSKKVTNQTAKEIGKYFIQEVCNERYERKELTKGYGKQKISELEEKLKKFESSLIYNPFFGYLHQFPQINVHLGEKDIGYPTTSRWNRLRWTDSFIEARQVSKGDTRQGKNKPPKIKLTLGIQPRVYGLPGGDFQELDHLISFYEQFGKAKRNFKKILKNLDTKF